MDKGSSTTPNIPIQKRSKRFGGSSAYFVGAVVSPFEAPTEARRLLGPGEPADGLQLTARPPRWPRPLASSLSPASYPLKIQRPSSCRSISPAFCCRTQVELQSHGGKEAEVGVLGAKVPGIEEGAPQKGIPGSLCRNSAQLLASGLCSKWARLHQPL